MPINNQRRDPRLKLKLNVEPQNQLSPEGNVGTFAMEGFGPSQAEIFAKKMRATLDPSKLPEDQARAERNINRLKKLKKDNDVAALVQKSKLIENPTEIPIARKLGAAFNQIPPISPGPITNAMTAAVEFLLPKANKTPQINEDIDIRFRPPGDLDLQTTLDEFNKTHSVEDLKKGGAASFRNPPNELEGVDIPGMTVSLPRVGVDPETGQLKDSNLPPEAQERRNRLMAQKVKSIDNLLQKRQKRMDEDPEGETERLKDEAMRKKVLDLFKGAAMYIMPLDKKSKKEKFKQVSSVANIAARG